jgi:hypothetical protein
MLRFSEIKTYVDQHVTPRSSIIKGAAYSTAWYTGALVHTYSQPVLVGIFRQATMGILGAKIGTGIGMGLVSPALVPVLVPAIAIAGATATYYGTTAIGNIAHEIIFGSPVAKKEEKLPAVKEITSKVNEKPLAKETILAAPAA